MKNRRERSILDQKNRNLFLALIVGASSFLHFWGIQAELPYSGKWDEQFFVLPAVNIAASGSPDPGVIRHPGSTLIYPLSLIYRLEHVFHGGRFFAKARPEILVQFNKDPTRFHLIGRVVTVLFSLAALFLVYLLGAKFHSDRIAFLAVCLCAFNPTMIELSKEVRTDSVSVFFCTLSLLAILNLYRNPSNRNRLIA